MIGFSNINYWPCSTVSNSSYLVEIVIGYVVDFVPLRKGDLFVAPIMSSPFIKGS